MAAAGGGDDDKPIRFEYAVYVCRYCNAVVDTCTMECPQQQKRLVYWQQRVDMWTGLAADIAGLPKTDKWDYPAIRADYLECAQRARSNLQRRPLP